MSVRSRAAVLDRPAPGAAVAKSYGSAVPAAMEQGMQAAQMTPATPFSPGEPLRPYDGYRRTPLAHEYAPGYNIAARPRLHERVSFEVLTGLVETYDVARICIRHRIASIRSLDWKLIAAEGYSGDVTDAIPYGMAALNRPDRKTLFKPWLAKWLRDILGYDAGTLYRMRNRGGRCVGLKVIDGRLIAPLQDYWGEIPEPPAEGFVQYAHGLPWNWLTRDDLIYEPFDPESGSLYGRAPIEDVILNANTDLRFQVYFLQRFTEGNLPAAFASAPDTWSPDQIEQFQEYWDSFMYADQSRKHQVRWMPPGSKLVWSNEKDFSDGFSLFMMRKTCASFSTVPSDLGFTEDVNRSSGESQADVQHRTGDLPLAHHVQDILSAWLQEDLGLPLRFAFDLGEEQDDRLAQAQADDIYIKNATVGVSEIRELRYGWSDPRPVPRYIFTERSGPIPVNALDAVAGQVDPETALPAIGAPLPHEVFEGVPGVEPNPPLYGQPLAEQMYGPKAIPAHTESQSLMPVKKDGGAAPGITSGTGIYGDPLIRDDEDGDDPEAVAKELAAFRRYSAGRLRSGRWRDFRFEAVRAVDAHNLNDGGRLAVRKAAGEIAVAGLAVLAADTGRVLMLQRALCGDDPAAGKLEFPGGHLDNGESPLRGAWREFAEETGCVPPPGVQTGSWTSSNGIYQGIVWTADSEASVPVRGPNVIPNPDDPDGDQVEAILWMDPADLPGNPMLRAELAADLDAVMAALGCSPDCCGGDCCQGDGGCCGGSGGCSCGGEPAPKAEAVAKAAPQWPGWGRDLAAASYWAALLIAALTKIIGKTRAEEMARAWMAEHPEGPQDGQGKREAVEAATAWCLGWLASQQIDLAGTCQQLVPGVIADGWTIGGVGAAAMADGTGPDWGGWTPGDTDVATGQAEALGVAAGLAAALGGVGMTAEEMASGFVTQIARALVDGLAEGTGAVVLGAAVFAALSDADYANGSVLAQLLVAAGAAAMAVYLARKVQQVRWETDDANACPVCVANAHGSPYPITAAPECPAHPRCRCAVVPA